MVLPYSTDILILPCATCVFVVYPLYVQLEYLITCGVCSVGEPKPPHGIPESASAIRGIPLEGAPGTLPPAG